MSNKFAVTLNGRKTRFKERSAACHINLKIKMNARHNAYDIHNDFSGWRTQEGCILIRNRDWWWVWCCGGGRPANDDNSGDDKSPT